MQHYYNIPDPSNLPLMHQDYLDEIIKKHERYLKGQKGGARAVIQYHNLSGLSFNAADLSQADFTGSSLVNCELSHGTFLSASFFACDMRNARLIEANLARADFRGAYLAGADLSRSNLNDADLREGKIMKRGEHGVLTERKRSGGEGGRTILKGAKLTETSMQKVQGKSVDFSDADLTGVILRDASLSGADFSGANLVDCDMTRSTLTDATMRGAIIAGMTIKYAEKQGLDMQGAITERDMGHKLANLGKTLPELLDEHTLWVSTAGKKGRQLDLSGYDLRDVIDLRSYPLTAIRAIEGNFINQNLEYAQLQSGTFDHADFRDCNFHEADLRGSSFKYAQFARCNLRGAILCPLQFEGQNGQENRLQRVDLSGANLRYADLSECDLRDCILMGADLTGAVIRGSDLRRADFTGAILEQTLLDKVRTEDAIIDLSGL